MSDIYDPQLAPFMEDGEITQIGADGKRHRLSESGDDLGTDLAMLEISADAILIELEPEAGDTGEGAQGENASEDY